MENLSKLRWRCRRGTLELDIMFRRYLDRCYPNAVRAEQEAFLKLMDLEDNELIHYLIGTEVPQAADLKQLVTKMRDLIN
jgi:antitoxin CptB